MAKNPPAETSYYSHSRRVCDTKRVPVDTQRSPNLSLSSLPAEVRLQILHHAIEQETYHILQNAIVFCHSPQPENCSSPQFCHRHTGLTYKSCPRCRVAILPGILFTCSTFYFEGIQLWYNASFLKFPRSLVLTGPLRAKSRQVKGLPSSLQRLRRIHLDLGPAKHASREQSLQNREALTLLATHVGGLRSLKLTTGYYFGAEADRILLNSRIIKILMKFEKLKGFQLIFSEPQPGPVGISGLPVQTRQKVQERLELLAEGLRQYICQKTEDMNSSSQHLTGNTPNNETPIVAAMENAVVGSPYTQQLIDQRLEYFWTHRFDE